MPAAPKLSDGFGAGWALKVAHQIKAQYPGRSDGHIGIGRKVEVELIPKCSHTQHEGRTVIEPGIFKYLIHVNGKRVGQNDFLEKPVSK